MAIDKAAAKAKRNQAGPRKVFVMLKGVDGQDEKMLKASIVGIATNADQALNAVDNGQATTFVRLTLPKGERTRAPKAAS